MDEIEKYRDLLAFLEQLEHPVAQSPQPALPDGASVEEEDEEVSQWANLILGANGTLLREARVRTCRSGLAAVSRYMAERAAA